MERFTKEPQITAAIISVIGTIIGTLLISILLGFLEGRIGLGPVVAIIVFLLLLAIWILLAYRWGLRSAGVAAAVMLVVGSVIFLGVASTQMTAIPAPTHTPITAASTTTPTLAPSPTPAATHRRKWLSSTPMISAMPPVAGLCRLVRVVNGATPTENTMS